MIELLLILFMGITHSILEFISRTALFCKLNKVKGVCLIDGRFVLILCFTLFSSSFKGYSLIFAQSCLSDMLRKQLIESSDSILDARKLHLEELDNLMNHGDVNSRRIYEIPVVFHVVYKDEVGNVSDDEIYRQLDILNRDFGFLNSDKDKIPNEFQHLAGDTGIRFCLATKDGLLSNRNGITRTRTDIDTIGVYFPRSDLSLIPLFSDRHGGVHPWINSNYLNIYIADLGETIMGYAFFPGTISSQYDNVVINYRCFSERPHENCGMGRVAVHEIGHHFDLEHVWGDEEGCDSDDDIQDTPLQFGPYYGCTSQDQHSCGSRDLYFNHMDYVADECAVMFTKGQIQRMKASLLSGHRLFYHLNNNSCDERESHHSCSELIIHPNPVTGGYLNLTFLTEDYGYISEITVFDNLGRLVYQKFNTNGSHIAIPVHNFISGVYSLLVRCHKGLQSHKFIVP